MPLSMPGPELVARAARTLTPKGDVSQGAFVITHLLRDRPTMLNSIDQSGCSVFLLPIPYSEIEGMRALLNPSVMTAPRQDAWPPSREVLFECADRLSSAVDRFVFLDIGGYLAEHCNDFTRKYGPSFLGVVEDTEAGHRRYAERDDLEVPVISVARSPLKECEDVLVGTSIVSAIDNVMRAMERPLRGLQTVVVGYGKIGRSVAQDLWSRGNRVDVLETDPVRRALAFSMGFRTPPKELAYGQADLVVGVTGRTSVTMRDLDLMKAGCILVSGSSRNVEFEIAASLVGSQPVHDLTGSNHLVTEFAVGSKPLMLVDHGTPVNFRDAAVIGGPLQLAQAEILVAAGMILDGSITTAGLGELDMNIRRGIAGDWVDLNS